MSYTELFSDKENGFTHFNYMWSHGGQLPDGKERVQLKDALAVSEAPLFIPKVLTSKIAEAIEPLLVGEKLLEKIQYQPGQFISFPVAGAIDGDLDMAEEEEYPEFRVQMGPGTNITSCGKQGLAVKFSEEVIRYSAYDVITLHTRQAGKAMARYKEQKIFKMLSNMGTLTHDNVSPSTAIFGTTRGRNLVGAANGSVTMDDLFEAYSAILNNGFIPNMLLVHPLTWLMFVQDATLRAFVLQNGGGNFFNQWQGQPAVQDPFPNQYNSRGLSQGRSIIPANATNGTPSAVTAYSQLMQSAPELPSYAGFAPFKIIVSPFVPFDPATNTTSVIMADDSELGYLVTDEDLVVEELRDPYRDILKIKMRERYTLAIKDSGYGIAVLRNIAVKPNEIVLPARAYVNTNGTISVINRNTPIS